MTTPLSLALLSLSASTSYVLASNLADKFLPHNFSIPNLRINIPSPPSPTRHNLSRLVDDYGESGRMPSESEQASDALHEEATLRFMAFTSEQAVTIGMNLRKRFRASSRHAKGKGCVISIQTMQGATLFACSVGEGSDVSLDSWWRIEGMIKVVRRTGHSTFYVEKGISAIGRSPEQLGLPFPEYRIDGGAFPVWLTSSPITPVAVIAVYSGSSLEDHHLIVTTLKSYFNKMEGSRSPSTIGPMDN